MKSRIKLIVFLILTALLIFIITGTVAFADEGDELNGNITSIIDGMDLSELEEYLQNNKDSYLFNFGDTAQEIITYLVRGNLNADYSGYLNEIFSVLFKNVISLIPAFAQIVAISLLSAIISNAEGGIMSRTTAKAVKLACFALIIIILGSMLAGIISSAIECVKNVKAQVEIITPILVTLTVLTGGNSSGAIYQPSALFLSGGAIEIINGFIFPAAIAVIILNFLSKINPQISFTGVTKLLKSLLKWVIGITVTVFSLFLTIQSSASSLFDGIFFKATKYLVGNSVPIVGNFLSAGVDMIVAAGTLIRSSVGVVGIALLLMEIIQPVILLASFSLMLKITGAIVQPLGENELFSLFSDLSVDLEYIIAGLLTVAFMYALIIMLIINSATNFV